LTISANKIPVFLSGARYLCRGTFNSQSSKVNRAYRGVLFYRFPLSLSPKSLSAWPPQVVDHLVPNQVLGFFEFFRERERGKFFLFKGLQKPLSAQIQRKLKMRRLPPTKSPFVCTT
jgi:hypothetical protein